jgi:imidazole glycerol-phosphate synthase subunit HisH
VIALIDYGAGNLASVRKALRACGAEVFEPAGADGLALASAIVLPGVGHFGATAALDGAWRSAIRTRIEAGVPFLGICLGMQWLFEGSDEAPGTPGLGCLPGQVVRLPDRTASGERLKVPHAGWNIARAAAGGRDPGLPGLDDGAYFYFTHAYAAPVTDAAAATTEYGVPFASAVRRANICGVQFHPEKSGTAGLAVLRAFIDGARS